MLALHTGMVLVQQQLKFCRSHLDERSALNSTLEDDRSAKARYLEAEVLENTLIERTAMLLCFILAEA